MQRKSTSKSQSKPRPIINERYLLKDDAKKGGMANVYKARDLESDEEVAFKFFENRFHKKAETWRKKMYRVGALILQENS
jgi:serine/threonine protein kinase